jgi:hypothetical protein
MNTELSTLHARLEQMEQDNTALRTHFDTERQQNRRERRRLRIQAGLAFVALVGAILISPANRQAIAQGYGTTLAQLAARMNVVENKTRFQSADATARSTTFSGCNLFVNDGGGATYTIVQNGSGEGLGNLVIGYNEVGNSAGDARTGSHNLVLGGLNNYSSYGGLIAGSNNSISGPYASVSGGNQNIASGGAASVSGGQGNIASGSVASVSGGNNNKASNDNASVSGGFDNTASGGVASVSGGRFNKASGDYASVSGGQGNTASGIFASLSGGHYNTASVSYASVSGGYGNVQSNPEGWSGGTYHTP